MTIEQIEKRLQAEFPGLDMMILVDIRSMGNSNISIVHGRNNITRCRSVPDAIQKMKDALQPINIGKVQVQI